MDISALSTQIAAVLIVIGVIGAGVLGVDVAIRAFDWVRALFFDHNPDWAYRHGWADDDDGKWWKSDDEG